MRVALAICICLFGFIMPAHADLKLATGPYSNMHMLLKKTIFGFHVLNLTIQFDTKTQSELKKLIQNKSYSDALAEQVSNVVYQASSLKVTMHFLRDVGFRRFISEIRENIKCAYDSKVIDLEEYNRVTNNIVHWFSPLRSHNIQEGDELIYLITQGFFHTTFINFRGEILVDQMDFGDKPKLSLLGGYLAPCSDFREDLVRSLFQI